MPDLKTLYAAARRGFPGAEDRFFDELSRQVFQFAGFHLGRTGVQARDVREDISQEVLLYFLKTVRTTPARLETIERWDAVISQVCLWRINDHFRAKGRLERIEAGPYEEGRAALEDIRCSVLVYTAWLLEERRQATHYERWQRVELFMDAVGLPADTRHAIRLCAEGASSSVIAERTGLTPGRWYVRYHRFCKQFQTWLEEQAEGARTP